MLLVQRTDLLCHMQIMQLQAIGECWPRDFCFVTECVLFEQTTTFITNAVLIARLARAEIWGKTVPAIAAWP